MRIIGVLPIIFLWGCSNNHSSKETLFSDITKESGIAFQNQLTFTERLNPYTYRNFYNGAGVAIGDLNNDGLLDIYFAGNQVDNRLYVNEGNLVFSDKTESAGVSCHGAWSTGVTFVDINADGFLDIYVCKSGDPETPHRNNELFINNGNLTFTERSKEYGLDVTGLSVQAAFFDYDKDGDLDCYLLNNSIRSVGAYDLIKDQRNIPDSLGGGNKFFINDKGTFHDYSEEAHIYRSNIGFGLGITLGDFNHDSWTDIFVSNDFFERDYLYVNDQHGTFRESLTDYFPSTSMGSMGADFADLDNDGTRELFVTEMLPDSLSRRKTKTVYESWDKYQLDLQRGYHHQFSRNVLQKEIGIGNYAEVGRLAGVAASEWSWGALLFDMDNDGLRDIFVANGIYKDLLDRDYLAFSGEADNVRKIIREQKDAILKLIELMPTSSFPNYAFKNDGNLHFNNAAKEWGLSAPDFSSGSAYGDLDNDGDLDLVVSNINAPSKVYRNNSDSTKSKSITVSLSAGGNNTFAVGSEIIAYCGTRLFVGDNFVTRGFQSSVQPNITLGLGPDVTSIDSLLVDWPNGESSVLYNVRVNQHITIKTEDIKFDKSRPSNTKANLAAFRMEQVSNYLFKHNASGLVDFNRDRLLPMMYSNETPSLFKGDVNNDGIAEVYVGGGKNQTGKFIEFRSGKFESYSPKVFDRYALSEETKSIFIDVDKDGDLDMYLATGGRFFPNTSTAMMDKILFNNGRGDFYEDPSKLLFTRYFSTSVVKPIDFDNDGDPDLVVGERFDPFVYGVGGSLYLLENDGHGSFKDVTKQYAPAFQKLGMVTDIEVQDLDGDGWKDVMIVGDWMPITIFENEQKNLVPLSREWLDRTEGWWHGIEASDFNKDGKVDFVLANHGLNSFFKSGDRMYVNDFDKNGTIEQIFCTYMNGKYYPIADRDEFISQLPSLKKELLYYKDYGKKSIDEIFPESILAASKVFDVKLLSSILLLSDQEGYQRLELPLEAQYSPLYGLLASDFDGDGVKDLMAGGNQYQVKPQFGRYDASNGWFFKGVLLDGKFSFDNGRDLNVKGQIRDIEEVEIDSVKYIFFAKHDNELEIFKISH